jgi:DNA repair protein RadD
MMLLRPYQEAAKAAVYEYLRVRDDNPCVVIPTAGGKTPVIASLCKDAVGRWGGLVLILAHVKELLEQTADKLTKVCPEVRFGVYSAGLGRRDTTHPVIVAGIQSVYDITVSRYHPSFGFEGRRTTQTSDG